MTNRLALLPGASPSLEFMMAEMREQHPGAQTGIVIVFDAEGGMHTQWHCNGQEMAFAACRLFRLANGE